MKTGLVLALVAPAAGFMLSAPQTAQPTKMMAFSDPAFCDGLPGALPPVGQWDPLGLTQGISSGEIRRYREAETHSAEIKFEFLFSDSRVVRSKLIILVVIFPPVNSFSK